ncbi:Dihydroorotate oxidase [Gluconacetobacter diazotrophicus PA1 5]|uniref:Dihydroorotate dehydrogenase (quinone) n=2 Tax=Gluconacetobacter diazotrophicus TaxID=33996 RepID=A9HBE5_GLUDA|nr:Dihydroorotate oxidase [Gluconacetobacter diazotrophicus PA1 5]TWB08605.1 dihydroorotate oxidase A [Gluconacetobacter diazotrophicus]CAP54805.1 putative dihydroorotate dehydrogenase [Gluconacetobacter diazotrophicus PA1 5]
MMDIMSNMLMPLVRRLDPEDAHRLGLNALLLGLGGGSGSGQDDPALAVRALGLRFPNPIGIAAGFDKNALVVRPLARIGFGFVEAGTVTPRPQPGNPRPRLFRLDEDRAIINRMGFNNQGIDRFAVRLARLHRVSPAGRHAGARVPVGANLGINKFGADPERDYPRLVGRVKHYADYVVLNLSSPNTPGLRDLQEASRLGALLQAIGEAHPDRPPLLVKLSPDLARDDIGPIVEAAIAGGAQGLIVTNTTISRPAGLRSPHAGEAGGLSGRPLRPLAADIFRAVAQVAAGRLALVACGGIETGADIVDRVRAGADLVQLYSAFAYEGPGIVRRLKRETVRVLNAEGFETLADAKGTA